MPQHKTFQRMRILRASEKMRQAASPRGGERRKRIRRSKLAAAGEPRINLASTLHVTAYTSVISIMAFAMGSQQIWARDIGVPEVTITVLTNVSLTMLPPPSERC